MPVTARRNGAGVADRRLKSGLGPGNRSRTADQNRGM